MKLDIAIIMLVLIILAGGFWAVIENKKDTISMCQEVTGKTYKECLYEYKLNSLGDY